MIGCATVAPPPPKPQLPAKQWQAGELINSLGERHKQFSSLRALARLDYAGPDGKGNVQEAVLVQRPDRLRLETLTFLGAVLRGNLCARAANQRKLVPLYADSSRT
jgi:hypothetical protein